MLSINSKKRFEYSSGKILVEIKIRAERIKTQTEIIKNIVYILTTIGTLIKVWWSY